MEKEDLPFSAYLKLPRYRFVCSSLLDFDPGRFGFTSNDFIERFDFQIYYK